jgi:hypothetical protein
MKAPAKSISASLKGQRTVARAPESVEVSGLKKGVSMTVGGDGSVQAAPGMAHNGDRSAAKYTEPMSRVK